MGPQTSSLSPAGGSSGGNASSPGVRAALAGWLAARVAVAMGFVLAHLLSGSVDLPDGRLHLDQGLMTWDGTFYRAIAQGWYGGARVPEEAARFFPGYPALARLLTPFGLGNEDLALLLIANLAALAAAILLWRLATDVTGDPRVGVAAAWMVAVIPAANVMVFAYSESLMLLVVVALLLCLHHDRLGWVITLGLCAGLLRPTGVLLIVPVAIEGWTRLRSGIDRDLARLAAWVGAVLAPLVGLGAAMWIVSRRTGELAEAYRIQRELRDGFRDPVTRLIEAGIDLSQGHLHDAYNVAFAVGFLLLFVVALRHRQPISWLAFDGGHLGAGRWRQQHGLPRAVLPGRGAVRGCPRPVGPDPRSTGGSRCGGPERHGVVHQRGAAGADHPLSRAQVEERVSGVRGGVECGAEERLVLEQPDVTQEYAAVALEVHELLGEQEDPAVEPRVVHAVRRRQRSEATLLAEPVVDRPDRQPLDFQALGLGHLLLRRVEQVRQRHLAEGLGEHRAQGGIRMNASSCSSSMPSCCSSTGP